MPCMRVKNASKCVNVGIRRTFTGFDLPQLWISSCNPHRARNTTQCAFFDDFQKIQAIQDDIA